MSMEDYDYLFKIVLIGNAGVGKTCLVRRFTQGLFPPGQGATIGVDFMIKTVEIKGEKVKLQIWDTAGQERFRSITQSYYRSANALILTYDITCEDSFRCLPEWLREIEQYANNQVVTILVDHAAPLGFREEKSNPPPRLNEHARVHKRECRKAERIWKASLDILRCHMVRCQAAVEEAGSVFPAQFPEMLVIRGYNLRLHTVASFSTTSIAEQTLRIFQIVLLK
uniref:RAB30, member RAS oncogene family n=1 Tax=Amphiprion ocellaris TaxID=80972 RepID=A0A3Q1CHZ0_AMPOC